MTLKNIELSPTERALLIDTIAIAVETNTKRIREENIQEFDWRDLMRLESILTQLKD